MKNNMGTADRIIRLLAGLFILLLVIVKPVGGTLSIVLIIAGSVFIATSVAGFCPLYSLLGIKTCRNNRKLSS